MSSLLPPRPRWLKSSNSEPAPVTLETRPERICAWPWAVLGVILVAGVVLFYRLGSYRTFSSHEVYAVVPAREMIESRDWVFPTFGGLPRLRKPPLAYWIVAGSAKLMGELSPLTARLPSALAGLLLAGLMGLWAKRWYGPRAGWAAVFVQLTSAWFLMFARKAEIDMLLCLFTTTAIFLIANLPEAEPPRRSFLRWLGVYLLLSLAWLAKFHYGPAMVLAPVLLYGLMDRRWPLLKKFAHPIGLICLLSAIVIWPALVLEHAPNAWETWRRETIGRALGEMGQNPLWFYVPFLLWLPMPWLPFAVATLRQSWRAAWTQKDSRERFLWIWLFAQLTIVTLSAVKHKHYLLAVLPVFTLWAARGLSGVLTGFQEGRWRISPRWLARMIGLSVAVSVLVLFLLQGEWPGMTLPAVMLAICLCVLQSLAWVFLSRRQIGRVAAVNILCLWIGGVLVFDRVLPRCDPRVNIEAFAKEIRENVLPTQPVCVFRMNRDPLVYHLGDPVFRAESIEDLAPKLQQQNSLYVVGYERFINELGPIAEAQPLARLPKGPPRCEPLEGDLVLVKLTRRGAGDGAFTRSPNAN